MRKGVSAVVATILILLITVSLAASSYVFFSGTLSSTTQTGTKQVEHVTQQLATCIVIDSVYNNKIAVRNCGTGIVTNQSLFVLIDGKAANISMDKTQIGEEESGIATLSGWSATPLGSHTIKLTSGAAAVSKPVSVIENTELNKSLVAWWKFEEGSGTTIQDLSGNGNTGTISGTPSWTTGKSGLAFNFNGATYINFGDKPGFNMGTGDYTVDLWAKITSTVQGGGIISKGSFFNINPPTKGFDISFGWTPIVWYWDVYDAVTYTPLSSGMGVPFSDWVHITGIRRGGRVELWINNVTKTSASYPQTDITSANSLFIGQSRNTQKITGQIDEVRLFNKSFSPDEMILMIPA